MLCYNTSIMNMDHFEIERKFIIRRPSEAYLKTHGTATEIQQTYLVGNPGESMRVRKRWNHETLHYTLTIKSRVNAMRRIEREREISREEYEMLLLDAHPTRKTLRKTRWVVEYHNQMFEIDIFPFWKKQAYLELELSDESQRIDFPPEIEILREVTDDSRYTNRALAREIPEEDG